MFKFKNINKKSTKTNVVQEVSVVTRLVLKFWGFAVFIRKCDGEKVTKRFSFMGAIGFVFWTIFFSHCAYRAFAEDQTILRAFYSTKLKYYGDFYEKVVSTIYFIYTMYKIPFDISGSTKYFQDVVDIDDALENLGVKVDYKQQSRIEMLLVVVQSFTLFLRISTVTGTLWLLNENIPYARIFQLVFTDSLALVFSSTYCNYVNILTMRFRQINRILENVTSFESFDKNNEFRKNLLNNSNNQMTPRRRIISREIEECSKIYGLIFKATQKANKKFGLALVLTIYIPLTYIIINLFYFLEATSAGLFHDVTRYLNFLLYIGWSVAYNVLVIYINVYFSATAVAEAKRTTMLVHDILNADVSSQVKNEALQLSFQLLHQEPRFTASGLINLDYQLLLEGARFLMTFLGLLLQFATSP